MDKTAITFELLREDKRLVGFSLMGLGNTEAECFCYSFPKAKAENKATLAIRENRIIFTHQGRLGGKDESIYLSSDSGEFSANLSAEDAVALDQLLEGKGPYKEGKLMLNYLNAWGRGFELKIRES